MVWYSTFDLSVGDREGALNHSRDREDGKHHRRKVEYYGDKVKRKLLYWPSSCATAGDEPTYTKRCRLTPGIDGMAVALCLGCIKRNVDNETGPET